MPWTTIAVTVAAVALIVGMGVTLYKLGKRHGKVENERDVSRDRAEEMARDAEIAAMPDVDNPMAAIRGSHRMRDK